MVFFFFTHCCQHGDYGIVGQDKNPSWEVTWTENWLGEYENCLINTQNEILLPFFYHWEVVEWFAFFQF
jgi:hypothetical protein